MAAGRVTGQRKVNFNSLSLIDNLQTVSLVFLGCEEVLFGGREQTFQIKVLPTLSEGSLSESR
jgi:hypothetical protein